MNRFATLFFTALIPALSVVAASPTDPAAYERLLLPVYDVEGRPGAFGSLWKTELVLRNEGSQPVTVFHSQCVFFCTCVTIVCRPGDALEPGQRFSGEPLSPVPSAAFLYVERSRVDDLAMNLRVFDARAGGLGYGTEIPIVRERDSRVATTWLPNVPVDARFRAHLRILGISSATGEGLVRVRIYDLDGADPLFDQIMSFRPPPLRTAGPIPRPQDTNAEQPAFVEIGPLDTIAGAASASRLRIRIDSLTPDLRYWPYVAVTNNQTQQVTTITPQ